MKKFILRHKNALSGMSVCLLIAGVTMSFQDTPYVNQIMDNRIEADTLPEKFSNSTMTLKEYDRLVESLNDHVLRDLKEIDIEAIEREVAASLNEVNMDKIMKDVETSLNDIDLTKLVDDIKTSLQDINWKEHEVDVTKALQEAQQELEAAKMELKHIDKGEIEKELQQAKLELAAARRELKEINTGKLMKEAKAEVEAAQMELHKTRSLFNELEKDGLIDMQKGFSIEYKNKDLYINGEKQAQQIADKYRKFINGDHFKIKIEKE